MSPPRTVWHPEVETALIDALEMFPSKYKRNQKIQAYILEKTGEEKTISQINRKLADMSDQRRRPKTTHNHSLQTVEKVQSGAGQISRCVLSDTKYPSTSSHFPHSLNSDSFPSVPPYDGNGAIPFTDEARNLRSTNANVAHYPDAVSLQALGVNDPAHSVDPIPSADRGLTVSSSSSQKSSESVSKHGPPPSSWSSGAVPTPQFPLSSAVIQDSPVIAPNAGGMDEDVHWSITTAERLSGDTDTATGDAGVAAWEGTLFGPYSSLAPSFGDFGSTATYPFVAAPEPVCGPTDRGKPSPLVTDYGPVGVESPTSEPSAGAAFTPPVTVVVGTDGIMMG